ncbi:hypothetical protein [Floridanema evergladense]|uniref:Exostosin GT47 domain-containing protein n=1 Tax=Floridaenema evergladense BLCC-F167 TaxID=3153639 RepID=A0ABV4WX96_9CYAN
MKIYTFNAPEKTPVEFLYPLRPANRNPEFSQLIAQSAWEEVTNIKDCDIAIFPNKVFDPGDFTFDSSVFDAVRLAESFDKPIIIDATCDYDKPLIIPHASILRFGLFKTLKLENEFERPYWTKQKQKEELESLPVDTYSSKPSVGFSGTTNSDGKLFKVGRALPLFVAKKLLAKGNIARPIDLRLKKGMSHRLRAAAMQFLSRDARIQCNFDITNNLQDYYNLANPNRNSIEAIFNENMSKSDYILCVRGVGNYTARFYMTLNAGRIPLIVDTDKTFPFEEKIQMVKVPPESLSNIADFMIQHFESVTTKEFAEMKRENREVYNQFLAPHRYIPYLIQAASSQLK